MSKKHGITNGIVQKLYFWSTYFIKASNYMVLTWCMSKKNMVLPMVLSKKHGITKTVSKKLS